MKNIFKKLIFVIPFIFAACNNDDDRLEGVNANKPMVSIDTKTNSVQEGATITYTLTVDRPVINDFELLVNLEDTSTGQFRDFECSGRETTLDEGGFGKGKIGYVLTFPALAKTMTFTVTATEDLLPEQTETLKLQLNSTGLGLANVAKDSEFTTITVADKDSNDFTAFLNHSGRTTNINGTFINAEFKDAGLVSHEFCDYDLDVEIYAWNGTARTGAPVATYYDDCFGGAVLPSTAPNGNYVVTASFWDKSGITTGTVSIPVPLEITYSKGGVFAGNFNMNGVFTSLSTVAGPGPIPNPAGYRDAFLVTKVGTTYTVKQIVSGAVLASGRQANTKTFTSGRLK